MLSVGLVLLHSCARAVTVLLQKDSRWGKLMLLVLGGSRVLVGTCLHLVCSTVCLLRNVTFVLVVGLSRDFNLWALK